MALLGTGCASIEVPNVKLHAEIPFKDGAEAAFVETVSKKEGIISAKDWEKQKPYMLMIHIDDWAKIKKSWLKACRGNREKCNIVVKSIDELVIKLDNIIRQVAP